MAEFWVREYHVDGFRIDEFRGIDHWEFIQTFATRARAELQRLFPGRPFVVIAEDSWRRAAAARDDPGNPGGRAVVDAIWNFAFRDEVRRLLRDEVVTRWGEPARRDRIRAAVSGRAMWEDMDRRFKSGFTGLTQAINYITSHDVEKDREQRFMNFAFGELLRRRGLGDGSVANVRSLADSLATQRPEVVTAHADALDQARTSFALLLTSVGVPMILAGEEFGDVHDLDHGDWRLKMSDPVDWQRLGQPGHRALWDGVRDLVRLRTSHPALRRNDVDFFYFHPGIDENGGVRVFAYCRTDGQPVGQPGQVVVVVNAGSQNFPSFDLPWPWSGAATEHAVPARGGSAEFRTRDARASLSLAPFQARVFTT
jgi:1,4-alpha-glucan branching enzyme